MTHTPTPMYRCRHGVATMRSGRRGFLAGLAAFAAFPGLVKAKAAKLWDGPVGHVVRWCKPGGEYVAQITWTENISCQMPTQRAVITDLTDDLLYEDEEA